MSTEETESEDSPAAVVGMLAEVFGRAITPAAARGYLIALADMSPAQLASARDRALKTCRFMPSPAELRDLAGVNGPQYQSLVTRKAAE